MNTTALAKVKKKQKAYQRYLHTKEGKEYLDYTRARNQAKQACRSALKHYEKELAKNVKKNPKSFYAYAKSKSKSREHIPDLINEHQLATNDYSKAQVLNKFFCSIFTKEDINNMPDFNISHDIPTISDTINITIENVAAKLKALKTNKSAGPDNIHPRILHELSDYIAEPISKLFLKVFKEGTLPQTWKDAIITPLFKKGNRNSPTNYRPISLTCIIVKMFESILREHLLDHLIRNNLLSNSQHGFLPGRSCTTNLLTVLEEWTEAVDKGIAIDNVYLDFAKAFDTVPHARLLTKLKAYGIDGNCLKWITNFLSCRRQCVIVNGVTSDWSNVESGVPQGSVLGPLLFLIYINDLPDVINSTTLLFADDTKIYQLLKHSNSTNTLQNDIDSVAEWADKWKMRFNTSKCKIIHIGTKNPNVKYSMYDPIECKRMELQTTTCEKDLGVNIDNELKFSLHTTTSVNKANRIFGLIRRSFVYLDKLSFRYLFCALVRPHLEYCGVVYNPRLIKDKTAIENVLRRASKMIPGMHDLSYDQRLVEINIPSMKYRFQRGDVIEVYKWSNSLYNCATDMFDYDNDSKTRGHTLKIRKKHCRLETRKHFFSIRTVDLWNKLPLDVVSANSLNEFKNLLDDHWSDQKFIYYD